MLSTKALTLQYDSLRSETTEISFVKKFIFHMNQPGYHMKVRVNFAQELLLLLLIKDMPNQQLNEAEYIINLTFEAFPDEPFLKELGDSLYKHFKPFSHNVKVEITKPDAVVPLTLKIPAKVINERWQDCLKTKGVGTNPEYYPKLIQIFNQLLSELPLALEKCEDPESLSEISDLLNQIEFITELLQRIQAWPQDGLSQDIKDQFIALTLVCEDTRLMIHNKMISMLSGEIDVYFRINQGNESRKIIAPMIANCITKIPGFLEFLKYKKRQSYVGSRATDYRLPVITANIDDNLISYLGKVQHTILLLRGATQPEQTDRVFRDSSQHIIDASHFDESSSTQVVFITNISHHKLDLHGLDSKYAKKMTERFLKYHFLAHSEAEFIIDIGKASHSPDKKSMLWPPIRYVLYRLKREYPGFILSHENYDQETGLIRVKLPDVITIIIPKDLTLGMIAGYNSTNNKIPTPHKISFLNHVKEALNPRQVDKNNIHRIKVVFYLEIEKPDLIKYLKNELLGQKLREIIPTISILDVTNQEETGCTKFVIGPSWLDSFVSADKTCQRIGDDPNGKPSKSR